MGGSVDRGARVARAPGAVVLAALFASRAAAPRAESRIPPPATLQEVLR